MCKYYKLNVYFSLSVYSADVDLQHNPAYDSIMTKDKIDTEREVVYEKCVWQLYYVIFVKYINLQLSNVLLL